MNFPFICNNFPIALAYGVYITLLIRYPRDRDFDIGLLQNPLFCIFERYMELLFFIQLRCGFSSELIVMEAFGTKSTDFTDSSEIILPEGCQQFFMGYWLAIIFPLINFKSDLKRTRIPKYSIYGGCIIFFILYPFVLEAAHVYGIPLSKYRK